MTVLLVVDRSIKGDKLTMQDKCFSERHWRHASQPVGVVRNTYIHTFDMTLGYVLARIFTKLHIHFQVLSYDCNITDSLVTVTMGREKCEEFYNSPNTGFSCETPCTFPVLKFRN